MGSKIFGFIIGLFIGVLLSGVVGNWYGLVLAALAGFGLCWACGSRPLTAVMLGLWASFIFWIWAAVKLEALVFLLIAFTASTLLTVLFGLGALAAYLIRRRQGYIDS